MMHFRNYFQDAFKEILFMAKDQLFNKITKKVLNLITFNLLKNIKSIFKKLNLKLWSD